MFWIVFVGAIVAICTVILVLDRNQRTDFYAEISDEATTIKNPTGDTLFVLSNQIILNVNGRTESIIAVGKPGETGFDGGRDLPKDSKIINLISPSSLSGKRGKLLWSRYLDYCRALALHQSIGSSLNLDIKLPSTRLIVDVEGAPTNLHNLLSKSVFGWLLGNPLIVPKPRTP